jgi:hypothetical protein
VDILFRVTPDVGRCFISLLIIDYCPEGLPQKVFSFMRNTFGAEKCRDYRFSDKGAFGSFRSTSMDSIAEDVILDSVVDTEFLESARKRSTDWTPIRSPMNSSVLPPMSAAREDQSNDFDASSTVVLPSGKGRSSGTGLPHLMELFDVLTKNGNDFNVHVATYWGGTSIKITFSGIIMNNAPSRRKAQIINDPSLQGMMIA